MYKSNPQKFQVREITPNSSAWQQQPRRRGSVKNQNGQQQMYHTQVYNQIQQQQQSRAREPAQPTQRHDHNNAQPFQPLNYVRQDGDGYEAVQSPRQFEGGGSAPRPENAQPSPTLESLASSSIGEPRYAANSAAGVSAGSRQNAQQFRPQERGVQQLDRASARQKQADLSYYEQLRVDHENSGFKDSLRRPSEKIAGGWKNVLENGLRMPRNANIGMPPPMADERPSRAMEGDRAPTAPQSNGGNYPAGGTANGPRRPGETPAPVAMPPTQQENATRRNQKDPGMLMVDQEEYIKYKTQQQLAKYLQQEQAVNQPSKNTRTNSGGPSAESANAAALKAAKEATKKAQEREERALRKVEELEKRLRKGVEERLTLERKNMEHEKRLKQMQEALDDAMGRWKQSTTLAVSSINELKNTVVRLKDDVRELITYAVALEKGDTNGVPRPSQIKVPFVGRIETHPNIPAMQSQMAPQQQHYQQQQQFLYPPHPMPEHQQYHSPAQQRGHVGTVSSPQATYQQYAPVHQQPQHFAPVHQQPQQEQPQQQQPQQQAPVPFFSPSPRKAQMSPPIVTNSSPANTTVPPASDLSNGRTQTAPADTRNGDLSSHPIVLQAMQTAKSMSEQLIANAMASAMNTSSNGAESGGNSPEHSPPHSLSILDDRNYYENLVTEELGGVQKGQAQQMHLQEMQRNSLEKDQEKQEEDDEASRLHNEIVEKVLASKFSGSSTIPKAVKDDRMNMLNILFDESRGPTRDRVEQAMNQLFHGSKDIPEDVKEDRAQTLELLFNL